jgi:hypothetical protein
VYDSTFPVQPVEIQHLKLKGVGNPLHFAAIRKQWIHAVAAKLPAGRRSVPVAHANRGAALISWTSVSERTCHHGSKSANTNPSRSSTSPVRTPMGRENTGASYTNV